MATKRKTKAKKTFTALVTKRESAPPRRALIKWAEAVELLNEFEDQIYARINDDVFEETCVSDLQHAIMNLRCELFSAQPQEW
ncbi:unnamed protein product [Gemmata massiliana]|uniref:Uncharacterized protein n=1 Tax=Gemmata massiliana TaxID=1210884 RepID=A0A6P2CYT2_9BACT|nr:hypothetical protein [Gemmata massiliana]VTR94131.1 unnamed protein product [Gemmata massiliana]